MTPLRQTNFRIDDAMMSALQEIRERDGIPVSEQVRRALKQWIEGKGVVMKTDRRRAGARRQS